MSKNETNEVKAYAVEKLFTDTRTYDVIARTERTITIRPRVETGEVVHREDWSGSGYPQVWTKTESLPEAESKVLRLRKDGTYRVLQGGRPLRFTDEEPASFTDYRQ